jgi:nucleoside-diphosphate-sugar epimerase
MTTALVTGGAGFIGSNLVRLLCSQGWQVRVFDNLSTGYEKNLKGLSATLLKGDVRNPEEVFSAVKGADTVFHLAASIGNVKSLNNPQEDSGVNVIGTLNVLEAARRHKVSRIVYSSSAAIFGELVTMPIAEDHPQNPDSPYGVSKLAAEKHMLCFARLYGLTVVCLRYFNVYGVNQRYDAYGNVIPIFAQRLFENKPLTVYGDGEQTRDFVNVSDVARANYLAATRAPQTGVYNVGCGMDITINRLVALVQECSGITAPAVNYAPPRPSEVRHCRADISRAMRELGYRPSVAMEEGLRAYFEWFRISGGVS